MRGGNRRAEAGVTGARLERESARLDRNMQGMLDRSCREPPHKPWSAGTGQAVRNGKPHQARHIANLEFAHQAAAVAVDRLG